MKNIKIIITFLLISLSVQAQKAPYEKLEELSTSISNLQNKANGLSYSDGSINYELSFPEENFQVSFSNQLASKIVYKKGVAQELLALTENIDFTKATEVKNMALGGLAGTFRVYFPADYLKTSIYENGKLQNTLNENYLEFFFDKKNYKESSKLRSLINEMIALLKEEKKQPYAPWLNQAIVYNSYDKVRRETHLQKLINNGDSEAMRLKGEDLFFTKDNDEAMEWYKKAYDKGNIDALFNIGFISILRFSRLDEGKRLINKAADLGSGIALTYIADEYKNNNDYNTSAQYFKKAIDAGLLYDLDRKRVYKSILFSYGKLKEYSKIEILLKDKSLICSGIEEKDLINGTSDFLIGKGNCNETLNYLTQLAEVPNTNEVKEIIYENLYYLYIIGCYGTKGDKVKKNKKIAEDYQSKSLSFKN
jgi:TPR repeat protein